MGRRIERDEDVRRTPEIDPLLGETVDPRRKPVTRFTLKGNGRVPARLKFGLNIGHPAARDLASNVCFNAKVPNLKLLDKPGTFKWAPILNKGGSAMMFSNLSPVVGGFREANVTPNVWRESDCVPLERKIIIPDNGCYWLNASADPEIAEWLQGGTGWVTAQSDKPFLDGYYTEDRGFGIVGADHLF
ncbi:hypothetical protein [Algicella marina]|uniref:Uncharacterized protein n=1 Tax=Algicella marina TaxID=2683284 RepID=A0A6P1T4X0_9RHOB|nr:hypothetical protein [Algicella marina]QHQ36743.1 hypothetical protein GO499_16960 [Algicella marina]